MDGWLDLTIIPCNESQPRSTVVSHKILSVFRPLDEILSCSTCVTVVPKHKIQPQFSLEDDLRLHGDVGSRASVVFEPEGGFTSTF